MNTTILPEGVATGALPVVIDVWAPWCAPCRAMKPRLEKLEAEYEGRVEVVAINADDSPELVQQLSVYSLPTVILYAGGNEVSRRMGGQSENDLRALFEAAAAGEKPEGVKKWDRLLRIGGAALLYGLSGQVDPSWPLQAGALLLFFSAIHDRCPLLQGLKGLFQRS